ncbi:MAG: ATP-binding cassette domain-containing protein, partial [Micrococcales bacterium]|nr:ATP-binding cassette domain-containing protein [Micrococcales bacterium]
INLIVNQGEAVAILGANGSGKSSLVMAMLGLLPSSGRVELFGQTPGAKTDWRQVGYVPQVSKAGTGVPTSSLEVVRAGLVTGRWPFPPRQAKSRALAALDLLSVANLAKRPIGQLSGGQRQRVLIARALARQPRLMFLDEPTAGLDLETQHNLVQILSQVQDMTLVVVLHDLGEFCHCLSRSVTLDQGLIKDDVAISQSPPDHQHSVTETFDPGHHPAPLSPPGSVPDLSLNRSDQ